VTRNTVILIQTLTWSTTFLLAVKRVTVGADVQ